MKFLALSSLLLSAVVGVVADSGIATFNNYDAQGGVACPGFPSSNNQGNGIYAAALGDLSPLWTGPKCAGSINGSNCNGSGGCINCTGPSCSGEGQCGNCFSITCAGSADGETSGSCSGQSVKVKVVDACPSSHPENYCKLSQFGGNVPANQCCEAAGVNAFDIATSAQSILSSYKYNININIQAVSC
ncbi:hypothetical protein HYDPIDRAFT_170234 [Hydnomerulius pinastri MD-312]|uniref:Unplaced genomic scaffold scaffold_38, whole genome shotgun sequence n=1 Tax=Hydnomerulius pinastri MD-312 TaxID=994086 RepID=A0A0C9VRL0_9AGAM|nr:hypothetical protein HYDPIDRAFT_170234 [Hydnomerulius pinastri MD-312]